MCSPEKSMGERQGKNGDGKEGLCEAGEDTI